jgi:hypothetical protein
MTCCGYGCGSFGGAASAANGLGNDSWIGSVYSSHLLWFSIRTRMFAMTPLSKVGTVCVRSASTGLCGGCRVTGIPTATSVPTPRDALRKLSAGRDWATPGLRTPRHQESQISIRSNSESINRRTRAFSSRRCFSPPAIRIQGLLSAAQGIPLRRFITEAIQEKLRTSAPAQGEGQSRCLKPSFDRRLQ